MRPRPAFLVFSNLAIVQVHGIAEEIDTLEAIMKFAIITKELAIGREITFSAVSAFEIKFPTRIMAVAGLAEIGSSA